MIARRVNHRGNVPEDLTDSLPFEVFENQDRSVSKKYVVTQLEIRDFLWDLRNELLGHVHAVIRQHAHDIRV